MNDRITVAEFLDRARNVPVIDVRSEKEFLQGHIPGAVNLSLFNDEERAVVGTLYKNSGRESSVLKGLDLAGPKLAGFVKQLHKITSGKQVLVHCWRGGMRSESMAWLFRLAGYEACLLEGGYKAYRHFIRAGLSLPAKIILLGGMTGSGKTDLLHQLGKMGEQILDLEALACHKGSVFGGIGQPSQPTNEQFENNIYAGWAVLDPARPVWLEDESRMIGNVSLPDPLLEQMNHAAMIQVELSTEQRIKRLVKEYSSVEKEDLRTAVLKISEKLGGTHTKTALSAIDDGDFETVAGLSLSYYDKTYAHSVLRKNNADIRIVSLENDDIVKNAGSILEAAKSLK